MSFKILTPFSSPFFSPSSLKTQTQTQTQTQTLTLKPLFFSPTPKSNLLRCNLFTGIVEEMGTIHHLGPTSDPTNPGIQLQISASTVLDSSTQLGDSISVNGTCLTVSEFSLSSSLFTVGLSPETLRKTSLSALSPGSPVNLERALQPTSRMGGHFVQGHVDCTGEIVSLDREGDSLWVKVRVEDEGVMRYIVPKGFVTVDGTSLTVVGVYEEERCFDFMLVAYTQMKVVIPLKKVGDRVNLEVDILGKYVEKLLRSGAVAVAVGKGNE